MIKLYGSTKSRSTRCLWALEELGVPYEQIPVLPADAKKPEHLKLNPNGHVPVLQDDGLTVWESFAINLYLGDKYGKAPFWPASAVERAQVYQWTLFGITELEAPLLDLLHHRVSFPPEQRDPKVADAAEEKIAAPLKVLAERLQGREYLLGHDFTLADLNLSMVVSWTLLTKVNLSAVPGVEAWVRRCIGRDGNKKARSLP